MMSWKSLSRLLSGIRGAYNDINPSTLTGAIDVIVVEQPDGSFTSGPFHVRFGKLTALAPADKAVEVYVNGAYIDFIQMRLGSAGDAYFVDTDATACSSEHNNVSLESRSDIQVSTPWHPAIMRRRRRRARRDTVSSEPDSSGLDFEGLDDLRPQSDCEESSPNSLVTHFASDSLLTKDFTTDGDIKWAFDRFSPPLSESQVIHNSCFQNESSKINIQQSGSRTRKLDGVYLEDLVSDTDPTLKETYIYPPVRTKLRHSVSPNHQPYYESASHYVDAGYRSDGEQSPRSLSPIYPNISGLRLSLCGCPALGTSLPDEKFFEHLVSYEEFIEDPEAILSNPNLTIYLNGKYLNWQVAAPSILSILAFQTELPHRTLRRLEEVHMRKKEVRRSSWFSWGVRAVEPSSDKRSAAMRSLAQVAEISPNNQQAEVDKTIIVPVTSADHVRKREASGSQACNRLSSEEIIRLRLKPGRNDVEYRLTTKYQGTCICSASIFVWHWSDRIVISDVDGTITRSDVLGHLLPMLGHDWTHSGVARLFNRIACNGYRFIYLSARALGQAGITRSYLRQLVQDNISLPEGPILLSPSSLLHAFHQEVIENKPEIFKIKCLSDVCSLFPNGRFPFYAGFGNKANDVHAYEKAGIPRCRIFTVNPRGEVRNEFQTNKVTSYLDLSHMVDHYFPFIDKSFSGARDEQSICSVLAQNTPESDSRLTVSPVDLSLYSSFTYWRNATHESALFPVVE